MAPVWSWSLRIRRGDRVGVVGAEHLHLFEMVNGLVEAGAQDHLAGLQKLPGQGDVGVGAGGDDDGLGVGGV